MSLSLEQTSTGSQGFRMMWDQLQQGQKVPKPVTSGKSHPGTQPPGPHVNGRLLCPPQSWLKHHDAAAAATSAKTETHSTQNLAEKSNAATSQKPTKVVVLVLNSCCCSNHWWRLCSCKKCTCKNLPCHNSVSQLLLAEIYEMEILASMLVSCVCLFPPYSSQFNSNLYQTLYTGGHWSKEEGLNLGSHPLTDPDPGMFWRILHHCEIGHFYAVGLRSLEKLWIFMKILSEIYTCIWSRKSPLQFGSHPNSDCRSRYGWLSKFDENCMIEIQSKIRTADMNHSHLGGGLEPVSALAVQSCFVYTKSLSTVLPLIST